MLVLIEKNKAKLYQINPLFSCLDENSDVSNCEDINECISNGNLHFTVTTSTMFLNNQQNIIYLQEINFRGEYFS